MEEKEQEPNEKTKGLEKALCVFGFLTAVELMSLFVHLGDLAMVMVWQKTDLAARQTANLMIDTACLIPLIPITAALAMKKIKSRK